MANDKDFKVKNGLDVGGDITLTGSSAVIFDTNQQGLGGEIGLRGSGEGFQIYEPEESSKVWLQIDDDPAGSNTAFQINSTAGMSPVFHDQYHPNADKWTTARTNTVTLTGDVTGTGSASVDGTGNWTVSVPAVVVNDSHSHSNYVLKTGDTMTGDLTISKTSPLIRLYDSNTSTGNFPAIEFDTANTQGIAITFNEFDGELPVAGYGLVVGPSSTNTQFPSTGDISFNVLGEIYTGTEDLSTLHKVWHAGNFNPSNYLLTSNYVDDYVSSASFNTTNGVLTLTRVEGGTVTVDLDGRYLQSESDTLDSVTDRGASTTNTISVGTLILANIEEASVNVDGEIGYDLNDTAAPASLGTFEGTDPAGLYLNEGGSLINRIYHTGHFSGTNIANWQTAYGWGDHSTQNYALTTGDTFTGDVNFNGWLYMNVAGQNLVLQSDAGSRNTLEWQQLGVRKWVLDLESDSDLNLSPSGAYKFRIGGQRVFADDYHPNADKWTTARTNTVTLTGSVTGTGSASVDGSGNWTVTVPTTTNHTHNYDNYGSWTAEDGDGTQYTVTSGDVLKFAEGSGINVNFSADDVLRIEYNGNEIPGSVDLNTYRTTGFYAQNANADAASGSNYPTANAGILQVINDDYGNGLHTTQLYAQYNSTNYYIRTYYNGIWQGWRNLAQDTTYTVGNGSMTVSTGGGLTGGGQLGTANQTGNTSITISHSDTSSQGSVNNSNGTVIQDITLDTYGHITSIGSVNLDGRYQLIAAPAAPSITSTTLSGETVEIVFSQSATSGVNGYEIWSDGGGVSFALIGRIPAQDIAASMSFVDTTFTDTGTINYHVYAIRNGVYSTAATTTATFSVPSLDVANFAAIPDLNAFHLQYDLPVTRFLDHIEIYLDTNAASGSLARANASLIYSGDNPSYTYNISASDRDNYHQFWVECVGVA